MMKESWKYSAASTGTWSQQGPAEEGVLFQLAETQGTGCSVAEADELIWYMDWVWRIRLGV